MIGIGVPRWIPVRWGYAQARVPLVARPLTNVMRLVPANQKRVFATTQSNPTIRPVTMGVSVRRKTYVAAGHASDSEHWSVMSRSTRVTSQFVILVLDALPRTGPLVMTRTRVRNRTPARKGRVWGARCLTGPCVTTGTCARGLISVKRGDVRALIRSLAHRIIATTKGHAIRQKGTVSILRRQTTQLVTTRMLVPRWTDAKPAYALDRAQLPVRPVMRAMRLGHAIRLRDVQIRSFQEQIVRRQTFSERPAPLRRMEPNPTDTLSVAQHARLTQVDVGLRRCARSSIAAPSMPAPLVHPRLEPEALSALLAAVAALDTSTAGYSNVLVSTGYLMPKWGSLHSYGPSGTQTLVYSFDGISYESGVLSCTKSRDPAADEVLQYNCFTQSGSCGAQ